MALEPFRNAVLQRARARRLGASLEALRLPALALDAETDLHLVAFRGGLPLPPEGTRGLAQVLAAPPDPWGVEATRLAQAGAPALQAAPATTRTAFLASLGLQEATFGAEVFLVRGTHLPPARLAALPGRLDLPGATLPERLVEAAWQLGGLALAPSLEPGDLEGTPEDLLLAPADPDACRALAHSLGLPLRSLARVTGDGRLHLPDGTELPLEGPEPAEARPAETPAPPAPPAPSGSLEAALATHLPLPEGQGILDATLGGRTLLLPGQGEAGLMRLPDQRLEGGALALAIIAGPLDGDPFWTGARLAAWAILKVAAVGAEPRGLALAAPLPDGGDARLEQALLGVRQAALALEVALCDLCLAGEGPLECHVAALGTLPEALAPAAARPLQGLGGTGHTWAPRALTVPFDGLYLLGTPGGEPLALDEARALARVLQEGVRMGLLRAVALPDREGPLATALAMARLGGQGLQLFLEAGEADLAAPPAPLTALVSTSPGGESSLAALAATHALPLRKLGVVGGPRFSVAVAGQPIADHPMAPEPVGEA